MPLFSFFGLYSAISENLKLSEFKSLSAVDSKSLMEISLIENNYDFDSILKFKHGAFRA